MHQLKYRIFGLSLSLLILFPLKGHTMTPQQVSSMSTIDMQVTNNCTVAVEMNVGPSSLQPDTICGHVVGLQAGNPKVNKWDILRVPAGQSQSFKMRREDSNNTLCLYLIQAINGTYGDTINPSAPVKCYMDQGINSQVCRCSN